MFINRAPDFCTLSFTHAVAKDPVSEGPAVITRFERPLKKVGMADMQRLERATVDVELVGSGQARVRVRTHEHECQDCAEGGTWEFVYETRQEAVQDFYNRAILFDRFILIVSSPDFEWRGAFDFRSGANLGRYWSDRQLS